MTNIIITSTTNSIKVVFNDAKMYDERGDGYTVKKGTWRKDDIGDIQLTSDESKVVVREADDFVWHVSHNGSTGTLQVDTINGTTITSNSQLYDELSLLIE